MRFDFVLIAFASHAPPPLGSDLRASSKTYRLAPLAGDGPIYTADFSLWARAANGNDDAEETFCPQASSIMRALQVAGRDNCHFVMALTQASEFDTPGSPSVRLPLQSGSLIVDELGATGLTDAGFDVIDQWTGLSALTNVGYDARGLAALTKHELRTNKFGLFASVEDALQFANFASVVASEHAPFVPVRNIIRIPT